MHTIPGMFGVGKQMASILCDVALWLEHAREVRALSEVISNPEEKQQMLVVACRLRSHRRACQSAGDTRRAISALTDRCLTSDAALGAATAKKKPRTLVRRLKCSREEPRDSIIKTNHPEKTVYLASGCGVSINVLQECHTHRYSIIMLKNCIFLKNVLDI